MARNQMMPDLSLDKEEDDHNYKYIATNKFTTHKSATQKLATHKSVTHNLK